MRADPDDGAMTTGTALLTLPAAPERRRTARVEIVVPVYNEQDGLEASVRRLTAYLDDRFPLPWLVTIADNASTDQTWTIACSLAGELEGVQAVHLPEKGRGRALRATWLASEAPVVAYMDVDLSTDLDALLPLVAPLLTGHSDVAIGTRLAPGSRVVRGPKREAISRSYNFLLRTTLHSGFSDAQCGFKAMRTDVGRTLLPMIEDDGWFFDTELLVLAEHNGLRIHEVPVDWVDDPDSRVDIVQTATDDLRGIWRMLRSIRRGRADAVTELRTADPVFDEALGGQLVRFASIGMVSTLVFAALFALLHAPLGAYLADVVALAVCTVANTAANRRLTFSLRGRAGRARHFGGALLLALLPLALTLGTLVVLTSLGVTSMPAQLVAVTAANLAASLAKFAVLRSWVFRSPTDRSGHDDGDGAAGLRAGSIETGAATDGTEVDEPVEAPTAAVAVAELLRLGPAWHHRIGQLVRYGAVSVIATLTSLTVLGVLVATDTMAAGWANVVATAVGTVPSFELNRRWVWGKQGQRSVLAEVVPFVVLSFAGLALSTLTVSVTAHWAATSGLVDPARTIAVELANVFAWGALWIAQFVILDRVLFGRTAERTVPQASLVLGDDRA